MKESPDRAAGRGRGRGGGGAESGPVTDSPVWGWLLGLCPSARGNGGNPEMWGRRREGKRTSWGLIHV